jgi:hypothetical protein
LVLHCGHAVDNAGKPSSGSGGTRLDHTSSDTGRVSRLTRITTLASAQLAAANRVIAKPSRLA